MSSRQGFTLVEIMIAIVVIAIVSVMISPDLRNVLSMGKRTTVNEQAVKTQEALNSWVAQQSSVAAAAASFTTGTSGALVPKDLSALVATLNSLLMTDKDSLAVSGGHIVTTAMTQAGAYMDITWPTPYRSNYPRVTLSYSE